MASPKRKASEATMNTREDEMDVEEDDNGAAGGGKRQVKITKFYVDGAGEPIKSESDPSKYARSPDKTARGVGFAPADESEPLVVMVSELSDEVRLLCTLNGIAQKVGDSYANKPDIEAARAECEAAIEMLKSGQWLSPRESTGGVRVADFGEAWFAADNGAAKGRTVADYVARLNADAELFKSVRSHPALKLEAGRIAQRRMEERLAAAPAEALPTF